MEDTCRGESCWFYGMIKDLRGGTPDVKDCPFFVELIWTPNPVGERVQTAKAVKDCASKRSLQWLLEHVEPRLTGVQAANEQARDKVSDLCKVITAGFSLMAAGQINIEEKDKKSLPSC